MTSISVLFFDGVEELDAVGPWEVLRFWSRLSDQDIEVRSVSPDGAPVTCAHGLKVTVDGGLGDDPTDVLVHPGGPGTTALAEDSTHVAAVQGLASGGTLMASVCTGTHVLAEAGLLAGKSATTHWQAIDALRERYPTTTVVTGVRWVDDGDVVSAAGVSAGLDMALHLVDRLESRARAEQVARGMEYRWQPEP